jgi:hypothetical protein
MSSTIEYCAPKTIIASRATGEIRCVPSDSAQFIVSMPGTEWMLICSEPEELRNLPRVAPVKPEDCFTFEPVGGVVRKTAHALSYVPDPFVEELMLQPGQTELKVIVNHWRLDNRRAPRHPDDVAKLEAFLAEALPHRGIVTIPFRRPLETWQQPTVRKAIGLMIRHLPGVTPADHGAVRVAIDQTWPGAYVLVRASLSDDSYSVEMRLKKGACPAIFWWKWSGTLSRLDELIRTDPNEKKRREALPMRGAGSRDEEPNDIKLSWIEKAARKRLHGHQDEDDEELQTPVPLPVPPRPAVAPAAPVAWEGVPAEIGVDLAYIAKHRPDTINVLKGMVARMVAQMGKQ